MKQSKFIQVWLVEGTYSTATGSIEVEMNSVLVDNITSKLDDITAARTNKIIGKIDGVTYTILYAKTEEDIINACSSLKSEMNKMMIEKSNAIKNKSFSEQMEDMGFIVKSNNK